MPRLHSLELLLDAAGEAAVRRQWQALRDAGLPSMLDHAGATNTPHVTVIAVPSIDATAEARAVELIGPLLPIEVRASGLAVFGGERLTLARVVDVDDAVLRAVLDLRAATTGHQHPGWLPHLTLARRLPRADLPRAVEVVGTGDAVMVLTALRRWDPDAGTVTPLVTPREPPAPG
ncbi:2'-5' RNA ligase family protein [Nocardioides plantarum]|uniref:2'-5' RNA ligase family protein n=1 Tax=Nocardioides plantarum TaxID=29299 RepID=A0ABV5K5H8_9ACTN|nr:2'-5' RNA ligase family protein [Nocardioides plantarum]